MLELNEEDEPVNSARDPMYRRWYWLLTEFSRRSITHKTDKLPAISGLARVIKHAAGGRYLAGLFENDLDRGLLWSVEATFDWNLETDSGLHTSGRKLGIAPYWSWASIDRPFHTETNDFCRNLAVALEVVDIVSLTHGAMISKNVSAGVILVVRGYFGEVGCLSELRDLISCLWMDETASSVVSQYYAVHVQSCGRSCNHNDVDHSDIRPDPGPTGFLLVLQAIDAVDTYRRVGMARSFQLPLQGPRRMIQLI